MLHCYLGLRLRRCLLWLATVAMVMLGLHALLLVARQGSGSGHRVALAFEARPPPPPPPPPQPPPLIESDRPESQTAAQFVPDLGRTNGTTATPPAVTNVSLAIGSDRIPHILHQTWISDRIPDTYVPYVRSWAEHRPPLAHYYWTDASSLRFVARHYPELLATFRGYKAHLNRADAIRYMLLHRYGGIYADMDMMRLKDLTPLLNTSRELCYLSQERYEITRLFWGLDSSVMNALMLSAPGHEFMAFVVKALPRYAHHTPNVMESTGPFFLQNVFNEFQRSPPCNLSSPRCRCAVADPYMFMPQVDPIRMPLFRGKCAAPSRLKQNQLAACDMLDKVGWRNDLRSIGSDSYTHHGFFHYGFEEQRLQFAKMSDMASVKPDIRRFDRDFT